MQESLLHFVTLFTFMRLRIFSTKITIYSILFINNVYKALFCLLLKGALLKMSSGVPVWVV